MTKDEKLEFLNNFIDHVEDSIILNIDKFPDNWDGIELRQLIADKFQWETFPEYLTGKRKREYKNSIIVDNL